MTQQERTIAIVAILVMKNIHVAYAQEVSQLSPDGNFGVTNPELVNSHVTVKTDRIGAVNANVVTITQEALDQIRKACREK